MKDNHKTTSERMKELDKAVKTLDRALHDMAKSLSDFVNVIYRKGLENVVKKKPRLNNRPSNRYRSLTYWQTKRNFGSVKYICIFAQTKMKHYGFQGQHQASI